MIVDLSHTIRPGLVTYPGLPVPEITSHLTFEASREVYAPGYEFSMGIIRMIGNTGTYLDAPAHRYAGGDDLSTLSLDTLVDLPAVVVHVRDLGRRDIDVADLPEDVPAGSAVLLDTGWDQLFGTPAYAHDAPYLTEAAAQNLVDRGAALVGIDSLNIDDASPESAGARPTHSVLLAAGVHVVEHLTGLDALPATGSRFTAVPPKVEGLATFTVRAFATVPD